MKHLVLPLLIVTACAKPKDQPSSSLLLDGGAELTTETGVASTRPLDSGESFKLGYAYDKISGERRPSCLDPSKYKLAVSNVRATNSKTDIVSSKEDLARRLNIEVNAEASGSYGAYTGSVSSKVSILKESTFNARSIIVLMTYSHHAQELSIQPLSTSLLTLEAEELLRNNPEEFRAQCGDVYTKSVTTGSYLYITMHLESNDSTTVDNKSVQASVSAAAAQIFSASTSTSVGKESREALSKFNISLRCNSVGVSADPCAESPNSVSAEDLNSVVDFIGRAKKAMATGITTTPGDLTAVDEKFSEYTKPSELKHHKQFEVFFDYRPMLERVSRLLAKENDVNYTCKVASNESCNSLRARLAERINFCAKQQLWADCEGEDSDLMAEVDELQTTGGGKVVLYEHAPSRGRALVLDFNKYLKDPSGLKPDTIYNLSDFNFAGIATDFDMFLTEGYQLRIFAQVNGTGKCTLIKAGDLVNHFGRFNDKAQSFRLEEQGRYPAVCD